MSAIKMNMHRRLRTRRELTVEANGKKITLPRDLRVIVKSSRRKDERDRLARSNKVAVMVSDPEYPKLDRLRFVAKPTAFVPTHVGRPPQS